MNKLRFLLSLILFCIVFVAKAQLTYDLNGLGDGASYDLRVCTDENLLILAPPGGSNYKWYAGNPPADRINPDTTINGSYISISDSNLLSLLLPPNFTTPTIYVQYLDSLGSTATIFVSIQYENEAWRKSVFGITPVPADLGPDKFSCGGDSVVLTNATSVSSLSTRWLGPAITDTTIIDTLTVGLSGEYIIEICSKGFLSPDPMFCCVRDSVIVGISDKPSVSTIGNAILCSGTPITLTSLVVGNPSGITYQWQGDTSDLNATNVLSPVSTIPSGGVRNYSIIVTDTTSLAMCSDTASVVVEMSDPLVINLGYTDSIICASNAINLAATLSGGQSPYNPKWYQLFPKTLVDSILNPLIFAPFTKQFQLEVTDSIGCSAISDTVSVGPTNLGIVDILGLGDTIGICEGQNANLCIGGTGGTLPYVYSWTPTDSLATPTDSCTICTAKIPTDYTGRVTDGNGCFLELKFHVDVVSLPFVSFGGSSRKVCCRDTTEITVTASKGTGTGYVFTWEKLFPGFDTLINNGSDTALFVKTECLIPNDVLVSVTDDRGCKSAKTSLSVTAVELPEANPELLSDDAILFSDTLGNGTSGSVIDFLGNIDNPTAVVAQRWYLWDSLTNLGLMSTSENIDDTSFTNAGSYTMVFELEAQDSACLITYEIPFRIRDRNSAHVFNVITPNGDEFNEYLYVLNLENFGENELVIFNRWGAVLQRISNYQNDWNGGDLPDGTYFYHLTVEEDPNSPHKGAFMIIR